VTAAAEPARGRPDARTLALALLFVAGTVALVHGFAASRVIEDGLRAAWQPKGVRQFTLFLAGASASFLAAARGRSRVPLALLVAGWLVVAFGLAAVASVTLIAAAALALGGRIARGAAFAEAEAETDPVQAAVLRAAAGLALLLTVVQILAHFPVNTMALHFVLLVAAAGVGRDALRGDAARLAGFVRGAPGSLASTNAGVVWLVVLAAQSAVAAAPEAASDALAMHLMVPHQVAAQGRWSFDFHSYLWAVVPMGADWLYTTASLLGGEAAARLSNFTLLVAVTLLVHRQVRRALPGPLASLLVAGCAAAPIVFQESFSLWVENLLTLVLLAAALIVARSWARPRGPDLAAFALVAGGALMTKSLGLLVLPLVAALAASVIAAPAAARPPARDAAFALLLLVAVGGGTYLYAFAVTGNPLFPYFNEVFKSPHYTGRLVDERWMGHGSPALLYEMTFRSSVFGELYDGAFGFHHLLLLPAGVLVAFLRWPRAARAVLAATRALAALLVLGMQYLRDLYPLLWAAAVLEAEALAVLLHLPPLRKPVLATVGAAMLANLAFMPTGFYLLRDFPVDTVFSGAARQRFVTDEAPYRKLNEAINADGGARTRVLYLGAPWGAFLEGVPIYSNWYNPALEARVTQAETEEMAAQILAEERVTHVILDSDPDLPAFRRWLAAHGRRLLSLGGSDVYAIEAPAAAKDGAEVTPPAAASGSPPAR
jgi:4-amino-4-deoxy-L-arabinose transferase-like glycosyltransferase